MKHGGSFHSYVSLPEGNPSGWWKLQTVSRKIYGGFINRGSPIAGWLKKRETPTKIGQLNPKVDQFVAFFLGVTRKNYADPGYMGLSDQKTSQKHIPSVSINGGIPIAGWFIVENP